MSSDPAPADASTARLGEAVESYQAAVDDFDREVARLLGVNETDLRCLEILIREVAEPVTPRFLADRLGLTTGSVTAMLDRLERIGYLTRSPHPTDKRRLIVSATDIVRTRAFELLAPMLDEGGRMLTAHYDDAELGLITDFLIRTTELQSTHTRRLRDSAPYPTPRQ